MKDAGLPPIGRYEGTKHSMATDAIRRGVPERSLQKFLGHASIQSTRRYARLADSTLLQVLRTPAQIEDHPTPAMERTGRRRCLGDKRATRSPEHNLSEIKTLSVGPPGFEPRRTGKSGRNLS
ncbi:MAG: tyrosine-type recombinase/integrase [bacterium]|nr:tyrosine-type recombinase/integrase [bacterium]